MERPPLSDDTMPVAVNRLIARCWAQSPAQRPTMLEVRHTPRSSTPTTHPLPHLASVMSRVRQVVTSLTRIIAALELLEGTTSAQ
jgi:hypothetical protein